MNSSFYVAYFYKLAQFTRLNIFNALTSESANISMSPDPNVLYFEIPFNVFCFYTCIP